MSFKMLVRDTVTGECGVADVPCPQVLTAQNPIVINGTVITLNLPALMAALGLTDCDGDAIVTGSVLATCSDMTAAIAAAIAALPADRYVTGGTYNAVSNILSLSMSTGPAVGVDLTPLVNDILASVALTVNAPLTGNGTAGSPLDINFATMSAADVTAILTALNLRACSGAVHVSGAFIPTCVEMNNAINNAIAALPGDKFLQGLQSYNAGTNVLTLLMNDGSTVAVDMTGLVTDAVATALAAIDGSETKVTAGANVTVTGAGTIASPYVINAAAAPVVPAATDTVAGISQLAVAANYPQPANDTDVATPAYVAAALNPTEILGDLAFVDQCGTPAAVGQVVHRTGLFDPIPISFPIGPTGVVTPGSLPAIAAPTAGTVIVSQQLGFASITNPFCRKALLWLSTAGRGMITLPVASRAQSWSLEPGAFARVTVQGTGQFVGSEVWLARDETTGLMYHYNRQGPSGFAYVMNPGETLVFDRFIYFSNLNDAGEDIQQLVYNLPRIEGFLLPPV